jgi:hypothetical protein
VYGITSRTRASPPAPPSVAPSRTLRLRSAAVTGFSRFGRASDMAADGLGVLGQPCCFPTVVCTETCETRRGIHTSSRAHPTEHDLLYTKYACEARPKA